MGHNKGWEEAASMLSGASVKLKTCNAALLQAFGNSWEEVCRFHPFSDMLELAFSLIWS